MYVSMRSLHPIDTLRESIRCGLRMLSHETTQIRNLPPLIIIKPKTANHRDPITAPPPQVPESHTALNSTEDNNRVFVKQKQIKHPIAEASFAHKMV